MKPLSILAMMGLLAISPVSAAAEEPMTVQSLIAFYHFTVVGSFQSQVGVGILLEKSDVTDDDRRYKRPVLFACFASETPDSTDVTTRYCKPVR